MCGCWDLSDFVCFTTFFITAIVALLFVQYFFIYLDFETEERVKTAHLGKCMYFLILTFLGCLVFAGVQRKSISLLKWPSRLLVSFISFGLISLTLHLWTLDRVHKQSVRDLELKTGKLSLVIFLLLLYLIGVSKLVAQIREARANRNLTFVYERSHSLPSTALVEAFRFQKEQKLGDKGKQERQFNADADGINYYKLMLEGNSKNSVVSATSSAYSLKPGEISEV